MQPTTTAPPGSLGDRRVEAFRLSDDHGPHAIARFLPDLSDPDYLFVLTELVRADVAYFANRGQIRHYEDYARDFPELALPVSPAGDPNPPTDLTQTPAPGGIQLLTSHTSVAPVGGERRPSAPPIETRFPGAGDDFGGFAILEELGRGGFGRVFLAEERRLAGRRVVLKITPWASNEPERLARLQHTNIVPIQNAFRIGNLSAVQMPFFGRQTLADLIKYVRTDNGFPRVGGRVFSSTVARLSTSQRPHSDRPSDPQVTPLPFRMPAGWAAEDPHPIRAMLTRMAYPDAVVWLATRLADGLAHAHTRGILHLDLKPANVLFSDDGQPMLLDFNLGYDVDRQDRERIGGTWPYMAPEQIQEYAGDPLAVVDARTDLYALGVLLYELFTGQMPFPPVRPGPAGLAAAVEDRQVVPYARAVNPAISPSIDSVVRKLIDPDPSRRYQSADDLRTDLERHRDHLPLQFAANPSVRERITKWRRRNPRALPNLVLVVALVASVGLGGMVWRMSEDRAHDRAARTAREFHTALSTLRVDLASPEDTKVRRSAIQAGSQWLERYGVPAARDWSDVPNVRDLPAGEQSTTADALGELAILLAHAEMHDARGATVDVRREAAGRAAGWNRTAERWFATTRLPAVLWEQREILADVASDPELKATIPDERPVGEPTRTDLFLRGVTRIAAAEYGRAAPSLVELADRDPSHYAAHFALAYCYQQTSQHQRALERYRMARALAPHDARPAYNRGLILMHLRRDREAESEFTLALDRDAKHPDSHWHRALARRRLGDAKGAIDDLTRGLDAGLPRLSALMVRAEQAERAGNQSIALADRAEVARLVPATEQDYLTRGLLRVANDPTGALADFEQVVKRNPQSLAGWQNTAHVLADKLSRLKDAVAAQEKAVALYPEYAPARMGLAVLYARLDRRADAHREADQALLVATDPMTIYQAANVHAITSAQHPTDRPTALAYLRQALREGFRDFATIADDPDMSNIRELAEYRQAVEAARELERK